MSSTRSDKPRVITVDCPACGKPSVFSSGNPWRPFCSRQCKTIDLGAWASNQYVVAGDPVDPQNDGLPADGRNDN